ncbi:multiple epidermal growth factor-like domains protein 9 isoform X1 [Alosa pseudoharengus]|uniref:multiple epidermal growth factor-like domains protein 9 isoform X1 n=1 Tax=Alosa pseudoharengus TaxID=34774 RepID=UPI003F8A172E
MKRSQLNMLASPGFWLLVFLCVTDSSRAAPRAGDNNDSPISRRPRAVSNAPLELYNTTTMPNHLPDDKLGMLTVSAFSRTTPTTKTLGEAMTPSLTTTPGTFTESTKTMEPTVKRRDVTANIKITTEAEAVGTTTMYPRISSALPSITGKPTEHSTPSVPSSTEILKSTAVPPVPTTMDNRQDLGCNCSAEGTVDCNLETAQCVCLEGYAGTQCDGCEDGYFNNGSTGCLPCGCDSFGAVSTLCDSSGMCQCKTGVYGDKCDDCHPGFFHFSSTGCQPCQCNNHSNYCHPQSGICVNCQGNTKGPACEECKYNFYRTPGSPLTDLCTPCPCSSVTSTGSCHLDESHTPVCDQCKPEYQGPNCEQCRDGFYNADSICLPCNCSGNADPRTSPRTCNPDTGHCLSCINNTTGLHCERCRIGYTGDPLTRTCRAIVIPTPEVRTTPSSTQSSSSTMSSVNGTSPTLTPSTTAAQALLTTLGPPTDNTTTAPLDGVSWTQFNIIVLAVIIVVVVALMGAAGGVYTYREYRNRKLNAPFWTIELKEDNISFSSYHDSIPNADVSGLLEDEGGDVAPNGQLALSSPANLYKA